MIKTILPVIALAFIFSLSACKKIPVLPNKDPDVEISGPDSAQSHYIEYTNEAGKLFSTDYDNDGVYLFIAEVSYAAGGSIKGSFTGTVKTANGEMVNITDGTYNVKFVN